MRIWRRLCGRRALGTLEEMDEGGSGSGAGVGVVVLVEDFEAWLEQVALNVSKAQRRRHEALRETFGSSIGEKEKDGKERVT